MRDSESWFDTILLNFLWGFFVFLGFCLAIFGLAATLRFVIYPIVNFVFNL